MYELDLDSRLEPLGEHRFSANITDRWSIGNFPNGGYLAYVALGAAMRATDLPDPFSVTTHFLRPANPGRAEIVVAPVRIGRGHATLEARMLQDGKEILRQLMVAGDLSAMSGPSAVSLRPPVLPPPDECERGRAGPHVGSLAISDRIDLAMKPGAVSWMPRDGKEPAHSNDAELSGWLRFRDGRQADARSLIFLADALPPPVLNVAVVATSWVPTIELTVHVRARPAPGWLRVVFRTRALIEGYLEEDGEIWDSEGKLVAMSRQLARIHK